MAEVVVDSVSKSFGSHRVLNDVSLRVPDGSIFGLVGPNGAGKTTLLSIIAGLRRAQEGSVLIGSRPPSKVRIGFMPDTPREYPWLTVSESLSLAAEVCGLRRAEEPIDQALEVFGLAPYANVKQGSLSRGLRQRAALAATLIGSPEVVILDEPCSALDPLGRIDMLRAVAALRSNSTVVFSTHLLADVERICDRVAVIVRGTIVLEDSLERLRARAASSGFELVFDRPVPDLSQRLRNEPWCSAVRQESPGRLYVEVSEWRAGQRGILEAVADVEATLISLERSGTSLERALTAYLGGAKW